MAMRRAFASDSAACVCNLGGARHKKRQFLHLRVCEDRASAMIAWRSMGGSSQELFKMLDEPKSE
jgi:hypothetical protein